MYRICTNIEIPTSAHPIIISIYLFIAPPSALSTEHHYLSFIFIIVPYRKPATGPAFLLFSPRGSRSETEFIGFAGKRARTWPADRPHSSFLSPRGSRSKTEFIGFADRLARTWPADRPHSSFLSPRGSRSETEFIGFAGRRARTLPADRILPSIKNPARAAIT